MPTYAYRCTECEHEFEAIEKITARPRARKCSVCGEYLQALKGTDLSAGLELEFNCPSCGSQ